MMVEKVERLIGGYRSEPRRKLGEFDGEWVQVDAADACLNDSATPVGQLSCLPRFTASELCLKVCGRASNDLISQERRRLSTKTKASK